MSNPLAHITSAAMIEELIARGVDLADLEWEDCGDCTRFERFSLESGYCGAHQRPVYFPDGIRGDGDPHTVGWYSVNCESRAVPNSVKREGGDSK